jgi:IS30 family transposase
MIERHGGRFESITSDNGAEFHNYERIEERTKATFYFARPYHSWERDSNENANGLIRQYLPKGSSMAALTQQRCNSIAREINTRPRKRHGFKTPLECNYES